MSVFCKLVGSVLLVGVGWLVGWKKAEQYRTKVLVLQQIERLIARIEEEIAYRATPLAQLLQQVKDDPAFAALSLPQCSNLRQYQPPKGVNPQLKPYFEQLGNATAQQSAAQGAYYQKMCQEWLETAKQEQCKANELYTKLGVCGGVLVVLMLL